MATSLGKPSISLPVIPLNGKDLQVIVDNVRKRITALDSTVTTIQAIQGQSGFTVTKDLRSLQQQISNLQAELDALEAIVAGLTGGGEFQTDPRTEQLAGEVMALQQAVEADDSGRLPQVEASLATLQTQVDGIDQIGQTAAHAALLQGLQEQVDEIHRGYLV